MDYAVQPGLYSVGKPDSDSPVLAMTFTGASTFTSPSGVLREMTIAVPVIVIFPLAGVVLIPIKTFTG